MNRSPGHSRSRPLVRAVKAVVKTGLRHLPAKRAIFSVARAFHPPRRFYRRLPVDGLFAVPVSEGSFRLIGHGLETETELFWAGIDGFEERESLRWWLRICRRAAVIVDIGAYIGVYALAAAAVRPDARVFGFEPIGATFEMFRANCLLNESRVVAVRAAVGDRDGFADFYLDDHDLMTASLYKREGWNLEKVPMLTLKSFFAGHGIERIDAMKIDVETYEASVLAGMGDLLARSRPTMIVEVLNDEVGNSLQEMCGPAYLYFHIDEKSGPSRSDRVRRVSHESRNYLFCTEDAARSLGLA